MTLGVRHEQHSPNSVQMITQEMLFIVDCWHWSAYALLSAVRNSSSKLQTCPANLAIIAAVGLRWPTSPGAEFPRGQNAPGSRSSSACHKASINVVRRYALIAFANENQLGELLSVDDMDRAVSPR